MDRTLKNLLDNWSNLLRIIRTFYLYIEIEPQAKQSVRIGRGGHAFADPVKVKYVAEIARQVKDQFKENPIKGYVRVTCIYSFPWTKKTRELQSMGWILKKGDPDLDNLHKPLADACNTICMDDDAQIVCMQVIKVRSDSVGIAIKLEEVMVDRRIQVK